MWKKKSSLMVLSLALLTLLAAGCAVLTVDVDVYKGPLANTEQIQGEQVISLAMGVKPLLVQLRDQLEITAPNYPVQMRGGHGPEDQQKFANDLERRLYEFRTRPANHYLAAYMVPSNAATSSGYDFHDEFALEVNVILGLYQDRGSMPSLLSPQLSGSLDNLQSSLDEYQNEIQSAGATNTLTSSQLSSITNQLKDNLAGYEYLFGGVSDLATAPAIHSPGDKAVAATETKLKTKSQQKQFETLVDESYRHSQKAYSTLAKIKYDTENLNSLLGDSEATKGLSLVDSNQILSAVSVLQNSLYEPAGNSMVMPAKVRNNPFSLLPETVEAKQALPEYNPLGRGRPADGLETLIEDYLNQGTKDRSPNAWPTNAKFQNLMDGLAEFAQKVVTLGNDAKLLSGSDGDDVKRYVAVLQSVGNSILVQVDELKARAAHDQDLLDRSSLVGRAISQAGGFTAGGLSNWPPTNPPDYVADPTRASLDAKDAAQQLETVLQMEYMKALHQQALAPPAASSQTESVAKPKSPLPSDLDFSIRLTTTQAGFVTNAELMVPLPGGTKAAISLGSTSSATVLPPGLTSKTSGFGTNLILHLDMSSSGKLTNAIVIITNYIPIQIEYPPGQAWAYQMGVPVSSNGTLGTITIVTPPGSAPAASPGISLVLDIAPTAVSNSAPKATNASPDKFLALLDQAAEFRGGMVYLRPASSYLRSSYPASTFQTDQGITWQNLLQQQLTRQVPILGGALNSGADAAVLSEIDKQSWQNINTVRVGGWGHVNYVIVKDDIGNWYVKGFSSDPSRIFQSMAGLATFAAGGPIPNLYKSGVSNATTALAAASGSSTATVLGSEFNLLAGNYLVATTNTFYDLLGKATNLDNQVTNTWLAAMSATTLDSSVATIQNAAFAIFINSVTNAATAVIKANDALANGTNAAPNIGTNGVQEISLASTYDKQTTAILSAMVDYNSYIAKKLSQMKSTTVATVTNITSSVTNVTSVTNAPTVANGTAATNVPAASIVTTATNLTTAAYVTTTTNVTMVSNITSVTNATTVNIPPSPTNTVNTLLNTYLSQRQKAYSDFESGLSLISQTSGQK